MEVIPLNFFLDLFEQNFFLNLMIWKKRSNELEKTSKDHRMVTIMDKAMLLKSC